MKYIVIPSSILSNIPESSLDDLNLSPRYSVDESKVIMKLNNYNQLFSYSEDSEYPYPIYEGKELNDLLSSSEWTIEEIN